MKLFLKNIYRNLALLLMVIVPLCGVQAQPAKSVKQERNHVSSGNKLYKAGHYSEAEVQYRKALEANGKSYMAQFNLASALLRQEATTKGQQEGDKASKRQDEAVQLLTQVAQNCPDKNIAGRANYDLGNLAYRQQQYEQAIELYKNALRNNPNDENARHNLRLAQLKLKQNKNNKNDKNDKKNNQDKNKDKNKDKKQKQNQNQNKNNDKNQNQQQKPQNGGMSKQNMEQILRTMQNQENATQQRIKERRARMEAGERARTQNKW